MLNRLHVGMGWALCAALVTGACSRESPEDDAYFAPDDEMGTRHVPTYEEFKAKARVSGVSYELYLVEWDFPIRAEGELRDYYETHYNGRRSKSAVKLTPQVGPDTVQCNTNPPPANCIDDKFYQNEQLGLRYCVSNDFGANKATIVSNMEQAANGWQQVANIWFQYVPTHDGSCRQTDPVPSSVAFKVSPWSGPGACSFWPYSDGDRACVATTLVYNTSADFSPNTMLGVLKHEIGHILGFHHEHLRADAGGCALYEMRYLTPWDPNSIMGYPAVWGGCAIGGGNDITKSDGVGARALYGPPAAWIIAAGS